MTEEYKKTLFSYLIGNLPKEKGTSEEIFKEINEIPRDKWIKFLPNGWNDFCYEGLIQVQNSDLLVLYGGYKVYQTDEIRGIITILGKDFIPIKTIYKYDSGNYLRYIQCMIQIEDGNFVAIDCPNFPKNEDWSMTTSQKRFIMLNNFTQETIDYKLSLQKSYIIPYSNFYCRKMFKDINSSYYVFVGSKLTDQNSPDYDGTRIIDVKINVGEKNEWKYKDTADNYILGDSYVEFDENSNFFIELLLTNNLATSREIILWSKSFDSETYDYKEIFTFDYHPYVDSYSYENQSVFLNKNEIYFVQNNQRWGNADKLESKYIGLYYYNISTKEQKTIYEKYLGEYDWCNLEAIYIAENNNELYIQYNKNIDNINNRADYYFQRFNGRWNPKLVCENKYYNYKQRCLYVNNSYNLLSAYLWQNNPRNNQNWTYYEIKQNYNYSNYNGEPYINTNALISYSGEIYSNDKLVFARNLYNKTIADNTTVSTVEIPNNYLNNIDITSKKLLSETNFALIKDENILQKNVYETLFVNFINTLLIINKNEQKQVHNLIASTYLNNAINKNNEYDNAKLYHKVRVTYQNDTTKDILFEYQNEYDKKVDIVVSLYVDSLMNKLEIISNDNSIIYQTIDLTKLELNKYYKIKQKMEVL